MGVSTDYPNIPDCVAKSEGYQTGAMVKYQGNIFYANFWATEPGVGDADQNGWRFYDELYDQTSHTPINRAKIIAYIPTWRKTEGFNYSNDEIYQYITHGIISFLMFSEVDLSAFEQKSLDDVSDIISDVVTTGHRNGTRISIALGGATDYGFLNLMTSVGNDPNNPLLDRAVRNVVNFVTSHNLDGVDLDLECWWGKPGEKDQGGRKKAEGPHPAGYALTLFAQKLKQAMPDTLVSAAVFGTSWYGNNYDPAIADHVDWLGVMTYDLTGSWNASPVGPHTALFKIRNQESANVRVQDSYQESYLAEQQGEWPGGGSINNPILSVEDTLWYWTNSLFVNWQGAGQKIPRNKIAAGVPIYGYDFAYGKEPDEVSGQVAPGYRVIRYRDILARFAPDAHTNANIKVLGSTPRPSFIAAPGEYPYVHNIYLETPATAVTKLNFLKSVGAQGVIIWELCNDVWEDGKSIIRALYQNSGNEGKPSLHAATAVALQVGIQNAEEVPGRDKYEVQWHEPEFRRDMKVNVTEWLRNSSSVPAPLVHSEATTVEWSVGVEIGVDIFESVSTSLNVTFSRSYTDTNEYTGQVDPGRTARIIYVPRMHHFNGWITTYKSETVPAPGAVGVRETRVKDLDHVWCPLFFPLAGGTYELEFQEAICYVDENFSGGSVSLKPGEYNNLEGIADKISALRVPDGFRVTLFEHANFQGRSKTFTSDCFYVGDDFNEITSSIRVEMV
ncbi:MAG: glycosyl hydrolase family 18 protein [Halobacteriota archaeon]